MLKIKKKTVGPSKRLTYPDILVIIATVAACLWLFYEIYPVMFGTRDDIRNYTLVRRGMLFDYAVIYAKQGRISQLWDYPLLGFPFLLGKVWFYKLVVFASYIFDIWCLWLFTSRVSDKKTASICAMLMVSWSCMSNHHNLLVSYAFCHQIPIGLILLSLYWFDKWLSEKKTYHAILSGLFLLMSCMIYEAFVSSLLLFYLWAFSDESLQSKSFSKAIFTALKKISLQIVVAMGYTIVYFLWRKVYPSSYDGTEFDFSEPIQSLSVLSQYSVGFFPVSELFNYTNANVFGFRQILSHIKLPGLICCTLVSLAVAVSLPLIRTDRKKLTRLAVLSLVGMYVPCLIISFSKRHIQWLRKNVTAYVPSFYSYIFLVILIICVGVIIYRLPEKRNTKQALHIVITVAVFAVSLSGAVMNDVWRGVLCENDIRYRNFDNAVSSEEFMSCDENFQIYAPDNPGVHFADTYTEEYMKIYNPSDMKYFCNAQELLPDKDILCMRMPENYHFAVIAETDSQIHANRVVVRTISQTPVNLTLYLSDGSEFSFKGAADGTVINAPAGFSFDLNKRVVA